MKKSILFGLAVALVLSGCKKAVEAIIEKGTSSPATSGFVKYTIAKGQQYTDQSSYRAIETSEMKFVVKFDSSAVYQTRLAENQYDINKLYGFSDNNSDHHQYSARFGWRWSGNALRLFAYIYNEGAVLSKELAIVDIGKEINGKALEGGGPQHDHGEGEHQDADAVPEREESQPHSSVVPR